MLVSRGVCESRRSRQGQFSQSVRYSDRCRGFRKIHVHFDSLDIRFRRQEDLLREQKESEGRAVVTPTYCCLMMSESMEFLAVGLMLSTSMSGPSSEEDFRNKLTDTSRNTAKSNVYRHGFTVL